MTSRSRKKPAEKPTPNNRPANEFKIELLNAAQKMAWNGFQNHDVLFLLGSAGSGKTHLATAFAVQSILSKQKEKIVLTRPIVEAGEHLGYLPGTADEKIAPYMMPIYHCLDKMVGTEGPLKERILNKTKVVPIAYMRGMTFDDSICIFDEAQNATKSQLKLFLTRFGKNSKIIVTGDPKQSDIGENSGLLDVANLLKEIPGIGVIEFKNNSIVRHPLVGAILDKLENR